MRYCPLSSPQHELKLPRNVHWGYYDATVKPVLRVRSGRHHSCRNDGGGRRAAVEGGRRERGRDTRRAEGGGRCGDGTWPRRPSADQADRSLAADLRVTQVVDGTKGIHAMIAKSIFAR